MSGNPAARRSLSSCFDEVPEAQPFLGLAVELAPDNDFYRDVYDSYMGF